MTPLQPTQRRPEPKSAVELIQEVALFVEGIIAAGSDYPRAMHLEAREQKARLETALELMSDDGR